MNRMFGYPGLVLLVLSLSLPWVFSAGHWRYAGYRLEPDPSSLWHGMPIKKISGALQLKPSANGSLAMSFTNEDVEKATYINNLVFGFQMDRSLETLDPGGKVPVRAQLSFGGNAKAAALPSDASGKMSVDQGEYVIDISDRRMGAPATADGELNIPGGGPGATMAIRISGYIGSYGAFSAQMIIDYVWDEGTPPAPLPPDSSENAWPLAPDGYPSIGGDWMEEPYLVRIVQLSGGRFIATCDYDGKSWRVEGTISREGEVVSELVHTAGVPSGAVGYAQHRRMTLSPDGRTLTGIATFVGGSHPLKWQRQTSNPPLTPESTAGTPRVWTLTPDGYPSIGGDWMEEPYLVRIVQLSGGRFIATCDYDGKRWRVEGTISREGEVVSELVHTAGVPSGAVGYAQHRRMTLSPDGHTLTGIATFVGGSHPLKWQRKP